MRLALPVLLIGQLLHAEPVRENEGSKRINRTEIVGADPDVIFHDGKYWLYPTHTIEPNRQFRAFRYLAYSSDDLVHWKEHGPVLERQDISWWNDDGAGERFLWAPGVVAHKDRFYLYFSLGPNHPKPSRIGVAVSDHPGGPFVDSGKPLLQGGVFKDRKFEAIDAMVFIDPGTGTPFFYAGGGAGRTLRVFELKDSLLEFEKEVEVETPPRFTEGAFMHLYRGTYYLSYSSGVWNRPNYSVHYATATSATGPWVYKGAILEGTATVFGPGHHAFFKDHASDQWYIAYHHWSALNPNGTGKGVRRVAIQPIHYREDGAIEIVHPEAD